MVLSMTSDPKRLFLALKEWVPIFVHARGPGTIWTTVSHYFCKLISKGDLNDSNGSSHIAAALCLSPWSHFIWVLFAADKVVIILFSSGHSCFSWWQLGLGEADLLRDEWNWTFIWAGPCYGSKGCPLSLQAPDIGGHKTDPRLEVTPLSWCGAGISGRVSWQPEPYSHPPSTQAPLALVGLTEHSNVTFDR